MKAIVLLMLAVVLAVFASGCIGAEVQTAETQPPNETAPENITGKLQQPEFDDGLDEALAELELTK